MATYAITVNIEHDALALLTRGGLLLCMAQGFITGGNPIYNTIAIASEVAPVAVIKWTAVYSMYATKLTSGSSPILVEIKTRPLPITFGQGYILPDWINPSVGSTPDAPSNGFAFINKILASAAVAISGIQASVNTPVLITDPYVPGLTKITPLNKVALWFQTNVVNSTQIVLDKTDAHYLDLTNQTNMSTTYTDMFTWVDG